ncbi:MAG: DUF4389 domain-containing protein [Pseudomonadota bacterium]
MTASAESSPDAITEKAEQRPDRTPTWIRGGYMLFFVIAFSLAQTLHTVIAVAQFLHMLIFREANTHVAAFGGSLAEWARQTSRFLTCADEQKAWPFADWPKPRD